MQYKIFLIAISLITLFAQNTESQNLDSMSQQQRDSLLITRARKVIELYAPEYYREDVKPIVTRGEFVFDGKTHCFGDAPDVFRTGTRVYYIVYFGYDKTKETHHKDYLAHVNFWSDESGKPNSIDFINGCGLGLSENLFQSDGSLLRSSLNIEQVPFYEDWEVRTYEEPEPSVVKADWTPTLTDTLTSAVNYEKMLEDGFEISEEELRKFGFRPIDKKTAELYEKWGWGTNWWERIPKDSIK